MAAVSIMLTALLKNYPRKGNEINQIKPASGPRSSDIKKGRFRAALDVTSGDNFGSDPWRSSSRSSWIHGGKPRKRIHSFKNKSYRRAN